MSACGRHPALSVTDERCHLAGLPHAGAGCRALLGAGVGRYYMDTSAKEDVARLMKESMCYVANDFSAAMDVPDDDAETKSCVPPRRCFDCKFRGDEGVLTRGVLWWPCFAGSSCRMVLRTRWARNASGCQKCVPAALRWRPARTVLLGAV